MAEVTPIRPDIVVGPKKKQRKPRGPTRTTRFAETLTNFATRVARARAMTKVLADALEDCPQVGFEAHPQDAALAISDLLGAITHEIDAAATELTTQAVQS